MTEQMISLAGGIILDSDERVLLLHRNTTKRVQWEIPGGKQDPGETLEEVARRELKEELGVEVKLIRKLGEMQFQEDSFIMSYAWFLAEVVSGTPRVVEPETHDELRFFSIDELADSTIDLSANTQNFVAAILDGFVKL